MNKEVFDKNRKKLLNRIGENSIVMIFSGRAVKKSADEQYKFTPNRNFYYLTGIDEENVVLFMTKMKGEYEEKLFIKAPNPELEKWVGRTITKEEAQELSGIKDVAYSDSLNSTIHSYIFNKDINVMYMDLEKDSYNSIETYTEKYARELKNKYPQLKVKNAYNMIAALRMVKSEEEVEEIKKAIEITIEGVENLMKNAKPGMKECELEAYFDFVCKSKGVNDYAFKTIAASGVNATILHYVDNNCEIQDNDLILFDLGAQLNYYNADISRTFPANGKFTERQKEVYNAVLRVNEKVIEAIKPGVSYLELNHQATEWVAEECVNLGLIEDKKDVIKYYWHSVGHSLGLDTHDVGGRDIKFQPGMVWTVEPGIYIEEEKIGVRIEDDVLVTADGCVNLTKDMIKTVEDIEAFMKK